MTQDNTEAISFEKLQQQLGILSEKLMQVNRLATKQQQQLLRLKQDNVGQKAQIETLKADLKNFRSSPNLNKIVSTLTQDTDAAQALVLQLDNYIIEVDKCIAYLND